MSQEREGVSSTQVYNWYDLKDPHQFLTGRTNLPNGFLQDPGTGRGHGHDRDQRPVSATNTAAGRAASSSPCLLWPLCPSCVNGRRRDSRNSACVQALH
ncbi:hypothetical protein J6590_035969 [Homalodisca vitripennis]|nr:hypothetical protein J6590_035969 [Homalodisca vitripennis]